MPLYHDLRHASPEVPQSYAAIPRGRCDFVILTLSHYRSGKNIVLGFPVNINIPGLQK